MHLETPYYLIDVQELNNNIFEFQRALEKHWSNSKLGYSIKTNSLPWVVNHMHSLGVLAEVVSPEEYCIAQLCGYSPQNIIYNGPIKSKESFFTAIAGGSFVNLDSQMELDWLSDINSPHDNIGLRINLDLTSECPDDIGYHKDGFRFGFSETNGAFEHALKIARERGNNKIGLHFHCNSITRSTKVYCAIARHAVEIIKKHSIFPSYIDIGGGFFGGVPGKTTADEYLTEIATILQEVVSAEDTQLLIEPGSAIIASPVKFVTKVLDVKDTSKARIVTTNGSRINIDPLWCREKYLCSYKTHGKLFPGKQIICGYTCMDHDRIMEAYNIPQLMVDDEIIYERVGAYSMTFGGAFIRFFPEVYIKDKNTYSKVRAYLSPEDYIKIHS